MNQTARSHLARPLNDGISAFYRRTFMSTPCQQRECLLTKDEFGNVTHDEQSQSNKAIANLIDNRLGSCRRSSQRLLSEERSLMTWSIAGKNRRRLRTRENNERGLTPSHQAMTRQAEPVRIVIIDIDEPLPDLAPDERYEKAWVVFCHHGMPRRMTTLDLTIGVPEVQHLLQAMVAQVQESKADLLDGPSLRAVALPSISVVIPTIVSRVEELGHCIQSIEQVDYPDYEVILVDNRRLLPADDPLPSLVLDRPWLRVVREARPGVSAARNAGIANANGEVIAFTDDDVRVDTRWLRSIGLRMALNPQIDALSGLILPTELETPAQIWFERYYGGFSGQRTFTPVTLELLQKRKQPLHGSKVIVRNAKGIETQRISILGIGGFGAGANMAFRKTVLDRIGGFNIHLGVGTPARGGEDLFAMISILWSGGEIGYEPGAFVHHRHRREYTELLTQLGGYGEGFTAMLTALVRNNPQHSLSIFSQLPEVLKWKTVQGIERIRGRKSDGPTEQWARPLYPLELLIRECKAYFKGPAAYFRSRAMWRTISTEQESP